MQHLHAFVKDVELTEREWEFTVDFLTRTGQTRTDVRQEFILLSDVLGVSMPVETVNHRTGGCRRSRRCSVPSTGRVAGTPPRQQHQPRRMGTPCLVSGQVTGPDGEPLAGARVDVRQTNEDGFYDVQQPGIQPEGNLRGLFTAYTQGQFWFRSGVPRY